MNIFKPVSLWVESFFKSRQAFPAENCKATYEGLRASNLDEDDYCPICREDWNVLCRVSNHPPRPSTNLIKFSIDDGDHFIAAGDLTNAEFQKYGVKRSTLSPGTFERRLWEREHCIVEILKHMDHVYHDTSLKEKVCCAFGPMGVGKTMICDKLVHHAADLTSEYTALFKRSCGNLVVLAVTFNCGTSLNVAVEGQLSLGQKVALRLAYFWLYKGLKTFDDFLHLFSVGSLSDISFEAVLNRVVALCGCDHSLLLIDETLRSVHRVDLSNAVAVEEMRHSMSTLVCQQHKLRVGVIFTSVALDPMLECKAFSMSQDSTFYLLNCI